MKRFKGLSIVVLVLFVAGFNANAQSLKFGHINSDELYGSLPEVDSAQANLEKFRQELINYLELMSVELNTKNEKFNKESKNLSDIVRQARERELNDMNRRIQEYQATAQTQLQEKQVELLQPISTKVDKAIKAVGKENGFLYIFDVSQGGPVLYFDEAKSSDVTALVKAKLKAK